MPDSFGKRNRDRVKASKAAARDERRVARNQRQRERTTEADEPSDSDVENTGETPPD